MPKGAKKGSTHFEDYRMNPTTKKEHPKEPNKEQVKAMGEAIAKNVMGPNYKK
jgi:hypothetical protein